MHACTYQALVLLTSFLFWGSTGGTLASYGHPSVATLVGSPATLRFNQSLLRYWSQVLRASHQVPCVTSMRNCGDVMVTAV
eukprot:2630589-Amphidinium_carterae.2